jgi:hypothetical protein
MKKKCRHARHTNTNKKIFFFRHNTKLTFVRTKVWFIHIYCRNVLGIYYWHEN